MGPWLSEMPLMPLAAAEKQHFNASAALLREGRTLLAVAPCRSLEFDRWTVVISDLVSLRISRAPVLALAGGGIPPIALCLSQADNWCRVSHRPPAK